MNSPSDTPPIAHTITARVHDNAIARVPKLFTDSLAAIFTELLQNARRAEATRLYINTGTTLRITPPNPAAHCITVADDGAGIADPAILLSFGETGWSAATAAREDAAGLGIAALAQRGCTVHSASRTTPAWRVTLTPAHFLGRESAPVHPTSTTGTQLYPNGTEITFAAPEDLPTITKALTGPPITTRSPFTSMASSSCAAPFFTTPSTPKPGKAPSSASRSPSTRPPTPRPDRAPREAGAEPRSSAAGAKRLNP